MNMGQAPSRRTFTMLSGADDAVVMVTKANVDRQTLTVLVVEDHPSFAKILCAELLAHPRVAAVRYAATLASAQELLSQQTFDLCVVDLDLPDGNGVELIRTWAQVTPCLVLSIAGDEATLVSAIVAGAAGYLLKDGADMAERVLGVLSVEFPISAKLAAYLVTNWRELAGSAVADESQLQATHCNSPLSQRELEILIVLAQGQTYAETATQLHISPHTVADHIKKIYRKLAVNSRSEAVYQASKLGILNLDNA